MEERFITTNEETLCGVPNMFGGRGAGRRVRYGEVYEKVKPGFQNFLINTYEIKKVIFNPPATIVFWANGDKTIVKATETEKFDPEKGLAMAIAKRLYGDHYYSKVIKKPAKAYYEAIEKEENSEFSKRLKDIQNETAEKEKYDKLPEPDFTKPLSGLVSKDVVHDIREQLKTVVDQGMTNALKKMNDKF